MHHRSVPCCTICAFCVVLHCLVLCSALHCVCLAALLLWAEGSGQCNALPRRLGAVGSVLLLCTAALPEGSGEWELLPYTGSLPWGSEPRVVCCGVVWCGVVWCGVVWCGVVWCGVVWCGVVWCGVVWCGVEQKEEEERLPWSHVR